MIEQNLTKTRNFKSWLFTRAWYNNEDTSINAGVTIGDDVYFGGENTGDYVGMNIIKWNRRASVLSSLSGTNGIIYAMAAGGGNVYAGGYFDVAGGLNANNIAKWNGSSWSALGEGLNDIVYAVAMNGNNLYAGGSFTATESGSANYIAKWDGSAWSALGLGLNGPVYAILVSGSNLYVGGNFTTAGGVAANNIAKWDGSSWSALGAGTDKIVRALAILGSDLYVGGEFTTAGGVSANGIAKWSDSAWSALGSGVQDLGTNGTLKSGTVYAIAAMNSGKVYVGGEFTIAGGKPSFYFAQWNTDGATDAFAVKKASVKFNFPKKSDSIALSGTLPVAEGFNPSGKTVIIMIGGVERTFTLDAKGKGTADNNPKLNLLKIAGKMSGGAYTASPVKFSVLLKSHELFSDLKDKGFTSDKTISKPGVDIKEVPVIVSVDGVVWLDTVTFVYTATANKTGSGKLKLSK